MVLFLLRLSRKVWGRDKALGSTFPLPNSRNSSTRDMAPSDAMRHTKRQYPPTTVGLMRRGVLLQALATSWARGISACFPPGTPARKSSTANLQSRTISPSVMAWFSFWSWLRQAQMSAFRDWSRVEGRRIQRCPSLHALAQDSSSARSFDKSPAGLCEQALPKRRVVL